MHRVTTPNELKNTTRTELSSPFHHFLPNYHSLDKKSSHSADQSHYTADLSPGWSTAHEHRSAWSWASRSWWVNDLSLLGNNINWDGDGDSAWSTSWATVVAWASDGGKWDGWHHIGLAAAGNGGAGRGGGAGGKAALAGVADINVDN